MQRRSHYGIGFHQEFLIRNGGGRVWYLDKDGPVASMFVDLVRHHMKGGIDPDDPLWELTPFVDYPGDHGGTQYRFEWEREWRVPSGLRFATEDVAFLFIPEEYHQEARSFFASALEEETGPAYLCPYLDPRWTMDRLQEILATVPA